MTCFYDAYRGEFCKTGLKLKQELDFHLGVFTGFARAVQPSLARAAGEGRRPPDRVAAPQVARFPGAYRSVSGGRCSSQEDAQALRQASNSDQHFRPDHSESPCGR